MAKKLQADQNEVRVYGGEITTNLSKSDYVKLWNKLEPMGITVDDLVSQFLHDLLMDDRSSGSDERDYICDWFDRVYSYYPSYLSDNPFVGILEDRWLHFDEFVGYFNAFVMYKVTGVITTIRSAYPDDVEIDFDDDECISDLRELFDRYKDCVDEYYQTYLIQIDVNLNPYAEVEKIVDKYRR